MCQDQFGPYVSAKITRCLKCPVLTNTIPKSTSWKYSTMIDSVLGSHTYGDETTKVKDKTTARQSRTGQQSFILNLKYIIYWITTMFIFFSDKITSVFKRCCSLFISQLLVSQSQNCVRENVTSYSVLLYTGNFGVC